MEKKLVLIDGYGFLFRAYFAIKDLRKKDGTPVNGVYGFTKMIMNLLVDINATHIAIVFDSGKKTFRNELYAKYKANRPPIPDDLIPQFSLIRDVAKALHLTILEKVGYEADDIIATIAKRAEKENFEVLVVSSDKDLTQLVNNKVFIFDAMKNKEVHIEDVIEKWGVEPEKVLDVLSLIGDASDNVPGVPSIGPKTAVELIKEFGSVENLIDNLDKIKQEKRRCIIKENLDKLILSKKLITLDTSVDLEETLEDLRVKNLDPIELKNFLNQMEFYSIAKKVEQAFRIENDLFDDKSKNFEYKKITNLKTFKICIDSLQQNKNLYLEIITENNEKYDNFQAIVFIDELKKYINYIPLTQKISNDFFSTENDTCLDIKTVLEELKQIIENENIVKISHNIKKITRILKTYKINIQNYEDLSVISYVLDSGKFEHNLSSLIGVYLYNNVEVNVKNIEEHNKFIIEYEKGKDLEKITSDIFNFSCFKLETTYLIYKILSDRLKNSEQKKLYYEIEKPLIEVLADMEYNGITIDIKELGNLSQYFSQKIQEIEKDIFDFSGEEFNIGSPKQLGEILFEKLNIPNGKKSAKSGYFSTNSDILEDLAEKGYIIADKVLEWRQFSKLKSTYSDVLPKLIDKNNRVHTTFLNTLVLTGRLSSINPNLQNIPIKSEEGAKIRKTFIAKSGYKLVGADYSQIELRVLAEYAKVSRLIESFKNNEDIHSQTAKKVFGTEEISVEMRRMAKIINFSIVYGTTSYGLAKRLNSNNKTAKDYIDNYFKTYPEIKIYMDRIVEFVKKNGFVKTLFNRKCFINMNISGFQKSFAERVAINAPIQGSAADIIKMAMVKLYNELKNYDAKILLQVHDELVIEAEEEIAEEIKVLVENTMESIVKLSIPLIADAKIGTNWGEIH